MLHMYYMRDLHFQGHEIVLFLNIPAEWRVLPRDLYEIPNEAI
jgi:hypothetical protein